jgi:membrane-associated protein
MRYSSGMAQHIFELLRGYLVHYGYWAVAGALLLENAGVPVPGETVLLLASFLSFSEHRLRLPYIILIGTCAATLGDNVGYWIGHYGGRNLLHRYQQSPHLRRIVERAERLFERYGAAAIFFARFIAGMRIVAGPLAGILRMRWSRFFIWNLLGAATWVTVISLVGYFLGSNWAALVVFVRRVDTILLVTFVAVILFFWWRSRRKVSS